MKKIMVLVMVLAMLLLSVPMVAQAGNDTTVSVVLQGSARPASGWVVPLTVNLFTPGANVMVDAPLYTFTQTTAKVGSTAVVALNIEPGTYDMTAVSEHTLTNVKLSVVADGSPVSMGTLLEGDVDMNDVVDNADLNLLKLSLNKAVGMPGFNPMADLNRNGMVNATDFGMLKLNQGKTSPVNVP